MNLRSMLALLTSANAGMLDTVSAFAAATGRQQGSTQVEVSGINNVNDLHF